MWTERESSLADPHGGPAATDWICSKNRLGNICLKKFVLEKLIVEKKIFENEIPGGNCITISINNSRA